MRQRCQPRQADAHQAKALCVCLQKAQRHHDAVIKGSTAPAMRACGNPRCQRLPFERLGELGIICCTDNHIGCAELCKVPHCRISGGDVEVVCIHHGMGTGDDDGIGLQICGCGHRTRIGIYRELNLLLLSFADLRQDEGGMRHDKRC